MAAYDLITNGTPYLAGVYSLVPDQFNGGADEHTILLSRFLGESDEDADDVGWIIEAFGITMDAADDLTIRVEDPEADGPTLVIELSGATSVTWRQLAGEWFPANATVRLTTTTGVGIKMRFSARKDR